MSGKYHNLTLRYSSFNAEKSFKMYNFYSLQLLKHSNQNVKVKNEIDHFKVQSIDYTLQLKLDTNLKEDICYLKKSYQECLYNNQYKGEIELAFDVLVMVIYQKKYK